MSSEQTDTVSKKAMSRLASLLNKADEVGGEVRDYLSKRYQESERAQKLVAKVQALRGVQAAEETVVPRSEMNVAAVEDAATSVVSSDEKTGLGDPGIAAQIYGRSSCPWSGRAIRLLEDRKVDYDFIDLDDADHAGLETPLVGETRQNTVPYVYLRGQFIGGYNALAEVDRLGQLEYAIMDAAEREAHPAAKKIAIIPRPNSDETAPGESSDPPEPAE